MYHHIGVPVDLAHPDKLEKALTTVADLARHYGCRVTLVGITGPAPTEVAHNPQEYAQRLNEFAGELKARFGMDFEWQMALSSDPAADLRRLLDKQLQELRVDLVVMASHIPGFKEYLFSSNAGFLASHSSISVLVVRG